MNYWIIALLIVMVAYGQDCSVSASKDQLVTGSKTLTLTGNPNLQCFNVTIDSALTNPQITSGIRSVNPYNTNTPLDFNIRNRINNLIATFTLIINQASWTTITITYIATKRNNFYLGNYLSTADSLANCQQTQPYALTIPLPASTRPTPSSSLAVLIILNGIRTNATQLSLQFSPPSYDSTLGQINTTALTTITQRIQLIYFGYLLVDLATLSSLGYTYSFSTETTQGQFVYAGAVAISSSGFLTAYFAINRTAYLSCVGTTCSECQSPSSCLSLGGQVVNNQCVFCGQNQVFSGTACVCSAGTYLIGSSCGVCPSGTSYQASTQSCTVTVTCPTNSYYTGSSCVCSSGFYNISGSCQSCPANSYFTGSGCACNSGYYNISGTCKVCPTNSYFSGLGCVCNNGFYNISGSCQSCPSGTTYSAASQSCLATCGQFQTYVNNACQCISGYVNVSNQCYQTSATCGNNKYLDNGVCKCLPNLFEYYGGCYACPENSEVTAGQTGCVCKTGYILTSSYTCVLASNYVQSSSSGTAGSATTTTTGSTTTSSSSSTASSSSTINTSTTTTANGGTTTANGGTTTTNGGSTTIYGGSTTAVNGGTTTANGGTTTTNGGSTTIYGGTTTTNGGSTTIYGGSTTAVNGGSTTTVNGGTTTTNGGSTTTNGGSYSGTSSFYGSGNTFSTSTTTTPTTTTSTTLSTSCPSGALYSNGTCRSQTTIISNQSVLIMSAVYVNIIANNLPESITNNNCPHCSSLLVPSLVSTPSGVNASVTFIPGTTHQWVGSIVYQGSPFPVTLQLRINPLFSSSFTTSQNNAVFTTSVNPNTIPVYTLPATAVTNSLSSQEDKLGEEQVPQAILQQFKTTK